MKPTLIAVIMVGVVFFAGFMTGYSRPDKDHYWFVQAPKGCWTYYNPTTGGIEADCQTKTPIVDNGNLFQLVGVKNPLE